MKCKDAFILFRSFFSISLLTLGGGPAMLPVMERVFVEKLRWLTPEKMLDFITITQSLPGVIAIKMAILVGRERAGILGAVAAAFGALTPSLLIILILAGILEGAISQPTAAAALVGIRAGVAGLLAALLYRMGRKTISGVTEFAFAVIAFAIISFTSVSPVIVIVAVFCTGIIKDRLFATPREGKK